MWPRPAAVSMPYLSEVERGRKEASSEVLSAICGALRIELAEVLAEAGRALAAGNRTRARAARLRTLREQRIVGTRATVTSIAPRAAASPRRRHRPAVPGGVRAR